MRWNRDVLDRLFRASGLSSKEYFKRIIRDLASSLGIEISEEGKR